MFSIFELMQQVQQCGVHLFLDERGAHALPADRLPLLLRKELRKHRSEVIDYLSERGESVIDDDAVTTNRVEPAPEMSAEDKLRVNMKASRREYMNGQLVVNGQNSMGQYMRQLARLRDRRLAAESGELPPEGHYFTGFDPFKD